MNNNLRMSGTMFLMLKKSNDRRQREALEAAFKRADVNGDGRLSVDEYYNILKEHNIDCTRDEIMQIMQVADKDHDGYISREEFLGSQQSSPATTSKTEAAFRIFDKNHDGYVTKEEMLKMSKKLTKAQVDAVFARNDCNHDGKLTYKEFEEFMEHNKRPNDQQK